MPLTVAIIIIFIGAILLLAAVVNPRMISGQGGGFLVNMEELFRGQPGVWRVVGLVIGVVLIAGGAVGSTIQTISTGNGVVEEASPTPTSTRTLRPALTALRQIAEPMPVPTTAVFTTGRAGEDSCFGLPEGRTASLEAGQLDVPIIDASRASEESIALRLTDRRVIVGYVLFDFFPARQSTVFKIGGIADSECRTIRRYMPVGVRSDQNTVQNWDDLCLIFSQGVYSINFGWEDQPTLDLDFKKLSDTSEPTQKACTEALSEVQ